MNKKFNILFFIFGFVLFLFGIYLSVYKKEPHFYTFFSTGLFLIFLAIKNTFSKKKLFNKWKIKDYILFSILLLLVSVLIDRIALSLGYWTYPYNGFFDDFLKYVFEWAMPLIYFMIALILGKNLFNTKLKRIPSYILSLIIFVTILGIFTQYINNFSNSWIILKMPFTSYKIGNFFIIFQTLGYWTVALIPLIIYKLVDKTRKIRWKNRNIISKK